VRFADTTGISIWDALPTLYAFVHDDPDTDTWDAGQQSLQIAIVLSRFCNPTSVALEYKEIGDNGRARRRNVRGKECQTICCRMSRVAKGKFVLTNSSFTKINVMLLPVSRSRSSWPSAG